jgi:hypothetical protein
MLMRSSSRQNLAHYLTVGQAASFLGVSASTLRNWDRLGKVAARRHPVNRYRLYLQADLVRLLKKVAIAPARSDGRATLRTETMRGRR